MIWDPYSEFRSTTLDNGLTIHALQLERPWQRMGFVVHAGATNDFIDREGLAHFNEHMVSENSPVSKNTIIDYFKKNGGDCMLGSTSFWNTRYAFLAPLNNKVFEKELGYFAGMLLNEKIEKKIERERKIILNEFKRKYSIDFQYDLLMKAHKIIHKDLPVERMLCSLGTPATIEAINQDDLQRFYDMYYVPANMSIVAVGGYSLEQLVAFISKTNFGIQYKGSRRADYKKVLSFPTLSENRFFLMSVSI